MLPALVLVLLHFTIYLFLDLNDVENLYDGMINQCIDAMKIQYEVDQVLEKNILIESANQNNSSITPPLFTAERSLLLLA